MKILVILLSAILLAAAPAAAVGLVETYDAVRGRQVDTETAAGDPASGWFLGGDRDRMLGTYLYRVWVYAPDGAQVQREAAVLWRVMPDGRVSIGRRLFSPPDPVTGRMWETAPDGQMLEPAE